MISIISRRFTEGNSCKLSVRIKTPTINTAYALGISVDESKWNVINSIIKQARSAYKRGSTIFIDDSLTSQLWSLVRTLMIKEEAGTLFHEGIIAAIAEKLRSESLTELQQEVKRQQEQKDIVSSRKETFNEFLSKFCSDSLSGQRLKKGGTSRHSINTSKNYVAFKTRVVQYQEDKKVTINWDDLTSALFTDFKNYLVEKGYAHNTVSWAMSTWKILLNAAREEKLTTVTDFLSSSISVKRESADNVYIDSDRIEQLYSTDFLTQDFEVSNKYMGIVSEYLSPNRRKLISKARDIFMMGCLTGQRISDYKRINSQMTTTINGREFFRIVQQKTKAEVFIPVSSRMKEILNRYNGTLPSMPEKDMAKRVRICALLLGWTEDAGITEHRGTERRDTGKEFWQAIKTHTARRSFATNAYRSGVPLSAIMAVTGHSSEQMLRKYLKLDNKERGVMAAEAFERLGMI